MSNVLDMEMVFNLGYSRLTRALNEEISEYSPLHEPLASCLSWLDDRLDDAHVLESFSTLFGRFTTLRDDLDACAIGSGHIAAILNEAIQKKVKTTTKALVAAGKTIPELPEKAVLKNWAVATIVALLGMNYVESFSLDSNSIVTRIPMRKQIGDQNMDNDNNEDDGEGEEWKR